MQIDRRPEDCKPGPTTLSASMLVTWIWQCSISKLNCQSFVVAMAKMCPQKFSPQVETNNLSLRTSETFRIMNCYFVMLHHACTLNWWVILMKFWILLNKMSFALGLCKQPDFWNVVFGKLQKTWKHERKCFSPTILGAHTPDYVSGRPLP